MKLRKIFLNLLLMVASLLVHFLGSPAKANLLDPSFDEDGKVLLSLGAGDDRANSLLVQGDGKIILAGYAHNGRNYDFVIARLNITGELDSSFDGDGKLLVPVGSGDDYATAVALQSDGKIVLAGRAFNGTNRDFALVRLHANGGFDRSFNGSGKLILPIGSADDYAMSIALQRDGKVLVAGYSDNGTNRDFSIARLNTNGTLDSSFNNSGKLLLPIGNGHDYARAVAVQNDGKIAVAGYAFNGSHFDFAMARLHENGSSDLTFDGDGKLLFSVGAGDSYAHAVEVQNNGKIMLAGSANGTNSDFAIARLNANGSLDKGFGGAGKLLITMGKGDDFIHAMKSQRDGKIVLAGSSHNGSDYDFGIARLNADGSPDPSFEGDGKITLPIGSSSELSASLGQGDDIVMSLALQSDEKIVAAGFAFNAGNLSFDCAAVRLLAYEPALSVSNAPAVNEGSASAPQSASFGVTLNKPDTRSITVQYQTAEGTAKAGVDYVAKSGTLTFAPGEIYKTVSVKFIGDSIPEANDTFFLDLKTPVNATVTDSRGSAYVRNDDGPQIFIDNAVTLDEGTSGTKGQTFKVRLSAGSADTITVDYVTANGTAGPVDYGVGSGQISFAPGETEKTITIWVKGDTVIEPNETYKVNLSRPTFAVLGDSQGVAYIRNDDGTGQSILSHKLSF